MHAPEFEMVDPDSLVQAPYNPRTITERALGALARLMDRHGFVDPVIARREDRLLIGGHQRLRANRLRARPDALVPCLFLTGVSDARAKALNIALNSPAAQGRYDADPLARLLDDLARQGDAWDLPADDASAGLPSLAEMTGLEPAQIDRLLADLHELAQPLGPPLEPVVDLDAPGSGSPRQPPRPEPAPKAILTFEIPDPLYRQVKPAFDELISAHNLTCHVAFQ